MCAGFTGCQGAADKAWRPPLSRSWARPPLCEDARGRDMWARFPRWAASVDGLLGTARVCAEPAEVDVGRKLKQGDAKPFGRELLVSAPCLARHGDRHTRVAGSDLTCDVIQGESCLVVFRVNGVLGLDRCSDRAQDVEGQDRHREGKERCSRVTQSSNLALEH